MQSWEPGRKSGPGCLLLFVVPRNLSEDALDSWSLRTHQSEAQIVGLIKDLERQIRFRRVGARSSAMMEKFTMPGNTAAGEFLDLNRTSQPMIQCP